MVAGRRFSPMRIRRRIYWWGYWDWEDVRRKGPLGQSWYARTGTREGVVLLENCMSMGRLCQCMEGILPNSSIKWVVVRSGQASAVFFFFFSRSMLSILFLVSLMPFLAFRVLVLCWWKKPNVSRGKSMGVLSWRLFLVSFLNFWVFLLLGSLFLFSPLLPWWHFINFLSMAVSFLLSFMTIQTLPWKLSHDVHTGVGTRDYYRKLGYELDGPYMSKYLLWNLHLHTAESMKESKDDYVCILLYTLNVQPVLLLGLALPIDRFLSPLLGFLYWTFSDRYLSPSRRPDSHPS